MGAAKSNERKRITVRRQEVMLALAALFCRHGGECVLCTSPATPGRLQITADQMFPQIIWILNDQECQLEVRDERWLEWLSRLTEAIAAVDAARSSGDELARRAAAVTFNTLMLRGYIMLMSTLEL